jgi:phosphatidylglycerol:prolipoprotein diacylglycerol transferase
VLAGIERFVIEFVRAKDDRFFAGLTAAQVIAIAIAAVGAVAMWMLRSRQQSTPLVADTVAR